MSNIANVSAAGRSSAADGFDFSESKILVVGGTSGVGLTTAISFAQCGARHLTLVGRNETRGKEAIDRVRALCPDADPHFLSADANDPQAADEVVHEAARTMGGLDVVVNSTVAVYQPTLFHDTDIAEIPTILIQQALGPILTSRAAINYMREQKHGAIINVASDAAKVPTPGECVIGAAMAAIVTFSRTLAVEAKRYGVRVNTITPSLIANTGSYDRAMNIDFSKKIFEKIKSQAHLGLTEPEDLANTILFLASPLASNITGQVVSVNGGISVA
ncbi:SDR family NAD(P)-dependent oxidoreductase [Rhodococcus opacus]|uniref:SDR family NAD(P)-dependent oxidoreductase n=1 Tax=Rhodococcus opacus TaxID=37919 RepID=A0ABT4NPA7_RHOOP|nr:SDR family oxidoreductase [Rhodococcus opacus]MCZ4589201.1 SDR family NAD(P)-dependent oxidoreductase [Rhodococcus opacus]MDV7089317.1 SDR family oxidoreductase [Rhodococcus opacus]